MNGKESGEQMQKGVFLNEKQGRAATGQAHIRL